MPNYYPLTVARSDGQLEVITRTGVREGNEPTGLQLNATPDKDGMVDCYKKLAPNDQKAIDWRRKIGGMLMHHLGAKAHSDRNYILKELPEGYILWEHIKYKVNKTADERKQDKGKHAAGVYERQDAYLYGHPQGRKKRFRSPADFFPHVLWLVTDKEGDPRNCSCKICSPEGDEETAEVVSQIMLKREAKPTSQTAPARAPAAPQKSTTSQSTFQPGSVTVKQFAEQKHDSEPNGKYLYRPGELVWFNKGQAWGLAVISKRQTLNNKPRYLLQPLSHPLSHPQWQIKDQEDQIRPWLAWSVPETTHQQIKSMTYEQVPWERVQRGDLGEGDAVVDGSILAAKAIDASYSLFDRVENPLAGPGEVHYNGMFLGAEKIWVGEPIRLRVPGDDIVVLILSKLIERTTPPSGSNITFVGDIYKLNAMPNPYKSRSEWPTPKLPARMVADLRFRNEVADAAKKGVWYEWQLLEVGARRGIPDVKGRWYETQTLLPILRGVHQFQQDITTGGMLDASMWMNGRGDSSILTGQRKKNRKDTLGGAVPADFKVSRGLDGPVADDVFPDAQQSQQPSLVHSDIAQYMDLDRF